MSSKDYYNKKKYTKVGGFRRKALLSFVTKDNPSVLDIGCSDGELGEAIKDSKKAKVYGADISCEQVAVAKTKLDDAFVLDLEKEIDNWPDEIKNSHYNYIILSEVLEHLLEPEQALAKVKKIADKDTEVLITVPNLLFWKNRLKICLGNFDYEETGLMDKGHVHFFSWKSFNETVRNSSYRVIEVNNHVPTRGTKFFAKLFPGLFAYQFVVKLAPIRKVVYTAIFNDKDDLLEPKVVDDNFDYICFTDNENLKSKNWKIVFVKSDQSDPVRANRQIKILAHKYLQDYDYSIYVDGNMQIKNYLNEFLMDNLASHDIAFFDHQNIAGDERKCIYKEAAYIGELVKRNKFKDDPALVNSQVEEYKKEGFPEDYGLISGMVILRKHNSEKVKKLMEDWWAELGKWSRRDQISFNYVAWKNDLKYSVIAGDSTDNNFFKRMAHGK